MPQKMHVNLGRGVLPHTPGHFFDQHPALLAVDASHAIDQKHQIAPESDELESSRRARLVIAWRGLMAAGADGCGSFPRPDRDEDGLPVFSETGLPVDKSWDGMALVQNSGKAHELSGIDTEDEDESQFSPIDARRAIALLPRLPRSFGVAGALDGRGEGSSARQKTRRILHALPPSPRRVGPIEKNHPKPCRQYVAARRRDHSRRERSPFSEKGSRRTTRPQRNPR